MIPVSLPPKCHSSPLLESFQLIVLVNCLIESGREPSSEHVNGLRTVDVVSRMPHEFFKVGYIPVEILPLHADSLSQCHTRFFFLEGVSELSIEREKAT